MVSHNAPGNSSSRIINIRTLLSFWGKRESLYHATSFHWCNVWFQCFPQGNCLTCALCPTFRHATRINIVCSYLFLSSRSLNISEICAKQIFCCLVLTANPAFTSRIDNSWQPNNFSTVHDFSPHFADVAMYSRLKVRILQVCSIRKFAYVIFWSWTTRPSGNLIKSLFLSITGVFETKRHVHINHMLKLLKHCNRHSWQMFINEIIYI